VVVEIDAFCLPTGAVPPEDQPPLIVDADRVQARQIAAELLEAIAWRHPENPDRKSHRRSFEACDNAALAEALLKYTFAALLKEREEDLAFFDQRIEKGLLAKLEGIVGSQFVRMDYGEAIRVLERATRSSSSRSSGASTCSRSTSGI
jgi:hypothetical protein